MACSETQHLDAGNVDAGTRDSGIDAGVDAGPAPVDGGFDGGLADSGTDAGDPCPARDVVPTWEMLPEGGALSGDTSAFYQTLVVVDDVPYISFEEYNEGSGTGSNVFVQRWVGASWETLGGPLSVAEQASANSLTLDPMGRIVAAWSEAESGLYNVYVRRLSSGVWQDLGGRLGDPASGTGSPSLTATSNGDVYLVYREASASGVALHTLRWTGTTWEEAAAVITPTGTYTSHGLPQLHAVDEQVFLSWSEDGPAGARYHVSRLESGAWADLGATAQDVMLNQQRMAIDPATGVIIQAYRRDLTGIEVRRWNGASWDMLPRPDVGLAGVTGAREPDVAIDGRGRVSIVFFVDGPGAGLYLRRYDDTVGAWRTLVFRDDPDVIASSSGATRARVGIVSCEDPLVTWTTYVSGTGVVAGLRYHHGPAGE
ncbi:MAG: hypothetical protein AB7S26_37225 [Sandaracinaceae bacterium]